MCLFVGETEQPTPRAAPKSPCYHTREMWQSYFSLRGIASAADAQEEEGHVFPLTSKVLCCSKVKLKGRLAGCENSETTTQKTTAIGNLMTQVLLWLQPLTLSPEGAECSLQEPYLLFWKVLLWLTCIGQHTVPLQALLSHHIGVGMHLCMR